MIPSWEYAQNERDKKGKKKTGGHGESNSVQKAGGPFGRLRGPIAGEAAGGPLLGRLRGAIRWRLRGTELRCSCSSMTESSSNLHIYNM